MNRTLALGAPAMILVALFGCNKSDNNVGIFNNPPTVSIVSPVSGTTVDEGTTIVFDGLVGDDSDVTTIRTGWSSDISGVLQEEANVDVSGAVQFTTANLVPGNHTITLTAIDEGAEIGTATVQVSVIDLPEAPTLEIIHPADGETGIEGEPFEFEIVVDDAQDAPEALIASATSKQDGWLCDFEPDTEGHATCFAILTGDTHELTFTVEDTSGEDRDVTTYFVVIPLAEIDNDGDGFTESQGDCDDTDKFVYPGASEFENGKDDDCDAKIDEGTAAYDDDGDGYSENLGDCNDTNAGINPGAKEACFDVTDNNCDSKVDDAGAVGCTTFYADKDSDGHGNIASSQCLCAPEGDFDVTTTDDCYDLSGSAKPGQQAYFPQHRGDGSFDYNCDGTSTKRDTAVFDCTGGAGFCFDHEDGWKDNVPNCGSSGTWVTDCSGEFLGCKASTSSTLTQSCR